MTKHLPFIFPATRIRNMRRRPRRDWLGWIAIAGLVIFTLLKEVPA